MLSTLGTQYIAKIYERMWGQCRKSLLYQDTADFDPGAVNGKIRESDGNLAVSLKLRDLLLYNGIAVVMSRTTDTACGNAVTMAQDVTNQINFVNNSRADIAVAVHFNSSVYSTAHGLEVLYSDLLYPNPKEAKLAGLLLNELVAATGLTSRGLKTPNNISIVKKSKIPCVLSECGFISNAKEYVWCTDAQHQLILAKAHAKAICKFFNMTYKEEEELVEIKVVVNGVAITNGYLIDNSSYVPVRALAEALGAQVSWDGTTNTVIIKK